MSRGEERTAACTTNLFELILSLLQIQMFPDSRVLTSESNDLFPIEIIKQPRIDLPRELKREVDVGQTGTLTGRVLHYLIEELIQQFDVNKHRGSVSQLLRDDIQERFWTEEVLVRSGFTPF